MTTGGYITLHRKIMENPVWQNEGILKLFLYLLLMANHEQNRFLWNGQEQTIERGQFLTGRFALAEALQQNPSTVKKRLKILENLGILTIKSTNKFSIITIVKYDDYQTQKVKSTTKSTNKVPTEYQQSTTNNNIITTITTNNKEREHTPHQQAEEFFNNNTKQLEVQEWLVGKGVPKEVAKMEMEKFISYWTEPDKTGLRQRWQDQKYFDLKRRFVTWFGKAVQFNKPGGKKRKIWKQPSSS